MHVEHIGCYKSPPDETLYTPTTQLHTINTLLAGVRIDNMYDHDRLLLDCRYNPIRLRMDDRFFYGVVLKPNARFNEIVNNITSTPLSQDNSVSIYRDRLKLYGLSCDESWAHLEPNIFPIDLSNIHKLSINTPCMNRALITDDTTRPWFSQYAQLKLYILKTR